MSDAVYTCRERAMAPTNSPLRPGRTEPRASWDPGTLRSPAAAPGWPPRSWSRPRCASAGCGGFRRRSAERSGPEPWSCSGCGQPGRTRVTRRSRLGRPRRDLQQGLPLAFMLRICSSTSKHSGFLVSGLTRPPRCTGSQFSISCRSASSGFSSVLNNSR